MTLSRDSIAADSSARGREPCNDGIASRILSSRQIRAAKGEDVGASSRVDSLDDSIWRRCSFSRRRREQSAMRCNANVSTREIHSANPGVDSGPGDIASSCILVGGSGASAERHGSSRSSLTYRGDKDASRPGISGLGSRYWKLGRARVSAAIVYAARAGFPPPRPGPRYFVFLRPLIEDRLLSQEFRNSPPTPVPS